MVRLGETWKDEEDSRGRDNQTGKDFRQRKFRDPGNKEKPCSWRTIVRKR